MKKHFKIENQSCVGPSYGPVSGDGRHRRRAVLNPGSRGLRRRFSGWLCLFACLFLPLLAPAQLTVRDVRVETIDGETTGVGDVLAFTRVRAGAVASPADLSRDVRRLLDTGRFGYVAVEVAPDDNVMDVIFRVQRRLQVSGRVSMSGNDKYRDGRIREWFDVHPGDFVDAHVLAVRAAAVEREYDQAFFPDAVVKARLEPLADDPLQARVRLEIDEGERARVLTATFSGVRALPAQRLRRAVGQFSRWDPRRLFRKKRYDEHELEAARLTLRDLYLDAGYLDVRIPPPEVERRRRGLVLHFDIVEGPRYHVTAVAIDGVERFDPDVLRSRLPVQPGDAASQGGIRAGVQRLREAYEREGVVDTAVRPMLEPSQKPGQVALRYQVREGYEASVRNIFIRGNTRTHDKVIRRELLLAPGDPLDGVSVSRSERRLQNLGFFSEVRAYDLPTELPDVRDLVYEVEEKRTGQFMIGAGFSSIDNLIGFAELSQGNFDIGNWPYFSGGGQKIRASVELGSRRQTYEVGFIEPWFLNRRLSLSLDAYRRERYYSEYDERRIGGSVGLTTSAGRLGRVGLRYTLETLWIEDLPPGEFIPLDAPDDRYRFSDEAGRYMASRLRLNWSQDMRDRPFVPTRGYQLSAFTGASGGILAGDLDVYEVGLNARYYLPLWFGHVLSLRGRMDVVDRFDGDLPPIPERLFLGGGRTLRGFGYREVGPKAVPADASPGSRRYRPLGGRSLLLMSTEYTVPVFGMLRLAGFSDAGNLWSDAFDFDVEDLAISGGVGLRVDIPGFPIRLDYAWILRRDDPLTDTTRWVIWIGYD